MPSFLEKLKGDRMPLPPQPTNKAIALAWLGGSIAIAMAAVLTDLLSVALVLGSFGASCVLVFGYPDVPFSQPRNVIAGHLISSLVGLVFLSVFGPHWWSVALSGRDRNRAHDDDPYSASARRLKSSNRFFNAT